MKVDTTVFKTVLKHALSAVFLCKKSWQIIRYSLKTRCLWDLFNSFEFQMEFMKGNESMNFLGKIDFYILHFQKKVGLNL